MIPAATKAAIVKPGPRPDRALDYLALAEAGLNCDEIGENFQVSRQTVSKALLALARRGYQVPEMKKGRPFQRLESTIVENN